MSNCVFCKIISGRASADVLYQDDDMMVFKDIKPASKFHFLAIPKEHIVNAKRLTRDHIQLIEKLTAKGKEILAERGGDVNDVRLGFHLPPFNSVGHLHLHVISPASGMSLLNQLIFMPNSWSFVTVDQVFEKINNANKL